MLYGVVTGCDFWVNGFVTYTGSTDHGTGADFFTGTNESTECYRGFTGRDSWVNGCFLFLHLGKDVFNYRGWELDPNGKM